MVMFDTYDLRQFDPNGGVLVLTTYWRPQAGDPHPEQPGEKLSILSYLPTEAQELCLCGSGQTFGDCCQPLPYWRPVCPNPGMQGYSLVRPQAARFTPIATQMAYAFLQDDVRLYCVGDTPQRAFWIYWGDPAYDTPPYGMVCFGDLELQEPHTLLVTALSDRRMEVLLDLLRPFKPGTPQMQFDPLPRPAKPARKVPRGKRRRPS